jgi:hypothetical protein
MWDTDDLKNAFGRADSGFKNKVYLTLAGLPASKENRAMKRISFKAVIAAAAVCVMFGSAALALTNTWGIMDFISGRTSAQVLPEAEQLVQTDVDQQVVKTDVNQQGEQEGLVTFTVREAVYDGKGIFVVVDAKPISGDYLLLGTDMMPSDQMLNMGPLWENTAGTIADYAQEHGKTMLHTWVNTGDWDWGATSIDFVLQEDGTLTYMLSGNCEAVTPSW